MLGLWLVLVVAVAPSEGERHLGGQVAAALMTQAPGLLAQPPVIEPVDVLAAKLPG